MSVSDRLLSRFPIENPLVDENFRGFVISSIQKLMILERVHFLLLFLQILRKSPNIMHRVIHVVLWFQKIHLSYQMSPRSIKNEHFDVFVTFYTLYTPGKPLKKTEQVQNGRKWMNYVNLWFQKIHFPYNCIKFHQKT